MTEIHRSPRRRHDRQYFYKYASAAVAKIILVTRTLRWSSPLLFNDPFDITQELRLNFSETQLVSALTNRIANLIENGDPMRSVAHPVLSFLIERASHAEPQTRAAMAQELRSNIHPPTVGQIASIAALRDKWRELVPNSRVLCFSEANDVTPMWLHYAEKYTGVTLEFLVNDAVDSAFLVARPVVYQDEPPSISSPEAWVDCLLGVSNSIYENLLVESQYVKTTAWAYEREWRIASSKRPGESGLYGDYGFHPLELSGIYFGPNCRNDDRADLVALLTSGLEHVQVYEANSDLRNARFTFSKIDR